MSTSVQSWHKSPEYCAPCRRVITTLVLARAVELGSTSTVAECVSPIGPFASQRVNGHFPQMISWQ